MDDYAGRVLADRYRLPLPPSDEFEFAETRAFDTYSGQEVLVRQVPLPEVVEAEVLEPGDAGPAAPQQRPTGRGARNPRNSHTTRAPSDPAVRRAIEAAEAAARIPDHPRLDQVFDVFAEGGSLWIVSEVVAARPLAALLAERPLSPYRAAEVASDVLTALRALHAHGWVHRNITVRTVLVCDDGRVMLTGLAAGAAEEALCGYDPVPDAGGGFDGRGAGGTASGAVEAGGAGGSGPGPRVSGGPGSGSGPRVSGGPGSGPAASGGPGPGLGPGASGGPGAAGGGRPELPGMREERGAGAGANGADTEGGSGGPERGVVRGASPSSSSRGYPLPAGDVRAARAGAIAAYRAGVRSAAAARALPPAGTDSSRAPGPGEGEPLQGTTEQEPAHPPGRIADPYGVAGRPAGRAPEVRHLSAQAERPGGAGSSSAGGAGVSSAAVGWHGAGRRVPGQLAGGEGARAEEGGVGRDASPGAEGAHHEVVVSEGPGSEGAALAGLPRYKDQITPPGHGPQGGQGPATGHGPAPAYGQEIASGHTSPEAAPGPARTSEPPSRWDELAGVGPNPGRNPATPLALERARQARMTVVGAVTERWAPEQAGPVHENWQLAAPVGPATDLWALGALLFRAVQGHAPYPEDSTYELVQLVCAEPPAFAEECGPLRPVVESLLRQDPTERPDFEELRGWLRSLVRSAPEPEAGEDVVPAPAYDRSRLPVVRRRGELVRKRRGAGAPPEHGRHKKGKRRRNAPERPARPGRSGRKERPVPEQQRALSAQVRAPERERMSPSAEKWERQQQRQMRQMSRRPQGGSPKRLGRLILILVLLGLAAAVAYAMLFMPKSGTDDQGAKDRKDQAGSVSSAPANPGKASPDGDAKPSGKPSSKPSKEPSKETSAPPAQDGGELPQGFVLRKDLEGFQVAVASGWDRKPANGRGQVVYSQGAFSLTVVPGRDSTEDYGDDPLAYQREDERELQPFRDSTWSTSAGLRQVEVGQRVRAEGQFTWDEGSAKVYARNAAIIVEGAYHIVLVKGPEAERDEVTRLFEQAVETYETTD
ncbi:protein kinase [Streptomyces sp. TRM66268-LWL]|uniref:Protein kinase n=1 Tax=Streptomyces polyasparticus TaxID=2767826 RepID=A0ABR7SQP6_9ACTN|nr:protein kinase [Streptomyces polyasparticus]MBC9717287.1 protein kinase [Streptomyces polyasparticus]